MGRFKEVIKNWKVILLVIAIVLAVVAIYPNPWNDGVAIRNVIKNSSASLAGIESPSPTSTPMSKERIIAINNKPVHNIQDYIALTSGLDPNITIQIKTNRGLYRLITRPLIEYTYLNETYLKETIITEYDNETNTTKNITKYIEVPKTETNVIGTEDIGLSIYDAPKTNIRKGLDLQGGTRVLLQPEKKLNKDEMSIILDNLKERLNVYGLSDVVVRDAGDLSGNQYVLVEIAGANEEEVKELLSKQGKFESKIGNETVFRGGSDIKYVCRSADCSGIDPQLGCGQDQGQWFCKFRFSISLSPESAQKQAELTKDLKVVTENKQEYLSEKLYLYLDDAEVDDLRIGADLKGKAATEIEISGSGTGKTRDEATFDSLKNMKRLQTILITGSLPVKLNIVKTDLISPVLGKEFVSSALLMTILSISAIAIVILIRYRKIIITLPIMVTCLAEVVILLGVASLIGWNIDIAAIAGIIVAVGTGVDDQIVITDETQRGGSSGYSWREKIKRAFFIIFAAYFTMVVAMLPLMFAGAGLLKGFALTSIIGVSVGVFITRPAYSAFIEILLKDR